MGREIWTGLSLGSVVTVSLFFLLELVDLVPRNPIFELVLFSGCFLLFFAIGFKFFKVFEPIMDFISRFTT